MKQIPLTKRKVALVDDEDFDFLNQWKWYAGLTTHKHRKYYYALRVENTGGIKTLLMQREILKRHKIKIGKGKFISFDNKNGLDNQKENLKVISFAQHWQRKRPSKTNASKYKGVAIQNGGGGKWRAQIYVNGKQKVLGTFNDEIEAAKKYDEAAIKYFGANAGTNVKLNLIPA